MPEFRQAEPGSIESNWEAQQRLRAELVDLESGEIVYGRRRRGHRWEDLTSERIVQVKSELIALNIEMNLRARVMKDRR